MRGDIGVDDVAAAINGGRYSTRMREPAGQNCKPNRQAGGQDVDRFKWITAHTSKGPVLNSLWVVKSIIPRHGTGAMFGRPGSGNTFLATDLCLHVAAGIPWRGHKIVQMEVAYCSMEAGNMGENRIHAWKLHHGRAWPPNFQLTPVILNLRSTRDDAEALAADLKKRCKRVGLVVIDTLSRAMCGGNENSSDDMGALVSHCEWLAAELDCFVLLIHHCGKDEARGLRGHTSLLGAINTEIEVKRQRGEVGTATVTKQRDGADARYAARKQRKR
jgi:RecA-family ATPase